MHDGPLSQALWMAEDAAEAIAGRLVGADSWIATGLSIDSRSLQPGDLFIALQDTRDGHEFVADAFARGASAALVSRLPEGESPGPLLLVEDTLRALRALGQAARTRCPAKRAAITGSVGKTSVKDVLAAALARSGPTHAAVKSFNNHLGVPLTLARMPQTSAYGVFEIGMNHRHEIAPLAKLVAPDLAIITIIAPVHLEALGDMANIAREKSDIFSGLAPGGAACVPADSPHADLLLEAARHAGAQIVRFGREPGLEARLLTFEAGPQNSIAEAEIFGKHIRFAIGAPGMPWAHNGLAVLAACAWLTGSADPGIAALEALSATPGRGQAQRVHGPNGTFILVDDSYNASPISIAAALETLALRPVAPGGRRIVALGDMLELGPEATLHHRALASKIASNKVDLVFAAGPLMHALWKELPQSVRGAYAQDADALIPHLVGELRDGDMILIKGSNGSRMYRVAAALGQLAAY